MKQSAQRITLLRLAKQVFDASDYELFERFLNELQSFDTKTRINANVQLSRMSSRLESELRKNRREECRLLFVDSMLNIKY